MTDLVRRRVGGVSLHWLNTRRTGPSFTLLAKFNKFNNWLKPTKLGCCRILILSSADSRSGFNLITGGFRPFFSWAWSKSRLCFNFHHNLRA